MRRKLAKSLRLTSRDVALTIRDTLAVCFIVYGLLAPMIKWSVSKTFSLIGSTLSLAAKIV